MVDNSAQAGSGARDANTLHRIDEQYEIAEITQGRFPACRQRGLPAQSQGRRTQPFWKINHHQDCFVLKFVKPE